MRVEYLDLLGTLSSSSAREPPADLSRGRSFSATVGRAGAYRGLREQQGLREPGLQADARAGSMDELDSSDHDSFDPGRAPFIGVCLFRPHQFRTFC